MHTFAYEEELLCYRKMSDPSMKSRQYRVVLAIPVLGLLGIVFWGYVVLYATGVIEWKLFSKVETFELQDKAILFFHALFFAGCIFLVGLGRVKVNITNEGINYHGIVRSRYIRWSEVKRLTPAGPRRSVHVWSETRNIEIPDMFRHQKELRDTILKYVRANAPDAVIDESRPAIWLWHRIKHK